MSVCIKVLGPGCAKCKKLDENVREAVKEMNLEADVFKVDDIQQIIGYGILSTPGIVFNEKVIHNGSVLNVKQIKELFAKYL